MTEKMSKGSALKGDALSIPPTQPSPGGPGAGPALGAATARERLMTMASPEFCNISQDDKQLIWWALRRIERLEGAIQFTRENARLADHSHWDREGNSGRTCPVCVDQRKVSAVLISAMEGL